MKKIIQLFIFCATITVFSQDIYRKKITGNVIVEGNDVANIAVYNASSKQGAITDNKGAFEIKVTLGDLIEISSLEYKKITVKINKAILKLKELNVFLIDEINVLDEVVVKSTKLTGNLNTDLNKVATLDPKFNAIYFGYNKAEEPTKFSKKEDLSNLDKNAKTHVHGLNIVNVVDQLLLPLFRSKVKDKEVADIAEVPSEAIKYYLGANFLAKNFNIPEHRVEEFIRYVENDTFNYEMLKYGHEIEFLELLSKKSKSFLK